MRWNTARLPMQCCLGIVRVRLGYPRRLMRNWNVCFGCWHDLVNPSQMVAKVCREWSQFGCGVVRVIVCERGLSKYRRPIVLVVGREDSEIVLDALVNSFCLSVSLGLKGGRQVEFNTQFVRDTLPELGNKLQTSVGNDRVWQTVPSRDLSDQNIGHLRRG